MADVGEKGVPVEVPVTEKKGKVKKAAPKRTAKKPSHPPYAQMITDAIVTLKERTGSSQQAIQKFIEQKHTTTLSPTYKKLLLNHLKKLVAEEKLVKVKGSFKLPAKTAAPKPKPAASKAPAKKKPAPKPTKPVAAAAKKKPATKPKTAKPAAPKKKPAAKAVAAKPKAAVKPKAKAATAKPPAKVARTSTRMSPGKKVAAKAKPVAKGKKTPARKAKK